MKYALPERLARRSLVRDIALGEGTSRSGEWLLIDSHIWYWSVMDQLARLTAASRRAVTTAAEERRLAISDASPWELLVKAQAGRLPVSGDARTWIETALGRSGAYSIGLRRDILFEAATLPGDAPGDPFDRVIIATAIREGMTLVTADRVILQWAAVTGAVRVLSA